MALNKRKRTPAVAVPIGPMLEALEGWLAGHGCRDLELLFQDPLGIETQDSNGEQDLKIVLVCFQ